MTDDTTTDDRTETRTTARGGDDCAQCGGYVTAAEGGWLVCTQCGTTYWVYELDEVA